VRTIGLTAGASAPPALITEVIGALREYGPVSVEEREITKETVRFELPSALRGADPGQPARRVGAQT
jgi:4-hydroxy-3-methylbut-2-enyl diphosphate reductase